jgi:hypothetical protein
MFSVAEPLLKSAALAAPHDRKVLYNLGCTVASQEGRQTEGLRYLKLSLGEKEAYRELAKIYQRQGKENEATFALQHAERIKTNQPIPQITDGIQEQLKKELSFYESKRAVAQLNSEAQKKEELAKQQKEQKNVVKVFPSVDIAATIAANVSPAVTAAVDNPPTNNTVNNADINKDINKAVKLLPDSALPNSMLPGTTLSPLPLVRPLPVIRFAEENKSTDITKSNAGNKITEFSKPADEPAPLRHLEVAGQKIQMQKIVPSAVVHLIPPQNPDNLPKYEFARIEPQKKVPSEKPDRDPVLTFRPNSEVPVSDVPAKNNTVKNNESAFVFRPKNDASVNAELSIRQRTEVPALVPVQDNSVQDDSAGKVLVQEPPVWQVFVQEPAVQKVPVQKIPVQKEIVKTEVIPVVKPEIKPDAIPEIKTAAKPVSQPETKFIANWQEPVIPKNLPVETIPAVKPDYSVIDTAAVPVERKPPVFERPVIEHPQQPETPQIAWVLPSIPVAETTVEPAKELTKEPVKELAEEPVKVEIAEVKENVKETVKEIVREEIQEEPADELITVIPSFTIPKPAVPNLTLPKLTTPDLTSSKLTASNSVPPQAVPVKPVLPKPVEHPAAVKLTASKPVVIKPAEDLHTAVVAASPVPPVSEQSIPKPPVSEVAVQKPPVTEIAVSKPPVAKVVVPEVMVAEIAVQKPPVSEITTSEPPVPAVQHSKRTPSLSMMSDAEFGETLRHIQNVKEQAAPEQIPQVQMVPVQTVQRQVLPDETAGFARTRYVVSAADATVSESAATLEAASAEGFARSSSFAQLLPSAGQNKSQTAPVQAMPKQTAAKTAVLEEPPVYQQEFRPLFFWNSPPQQKRRW